MSVGQAFADIPIIDVTTGEDTTLAAVIGNGAPQPPRACGTPWRSQSSCCSGSANELSSLPRAGKKTVIDFYTSW